MNHFERRILTGITVLTLLSLPLIVSGFYSLRVLVRERSEGVYERADELLLAEKLRRSFELQAGTMPVFVLSHDKSNIDTIRRQRDAFLHEVRSLLEMARNDQERASLQKVRELEETLGRIGESAFAMREKQSVASIHRFMMIKTRELGPELSKQLDSIVAFKARSYEQAKDALAKLTNRFILVFTLLASGVVAAAVMVAILLGKLVKEKQLEERKIESKRHHEKQVAIARKEAVDMVAHDLRNPLSALQLRIDLLARRAGSGFEAGRLSDEIQKCSEYIRRMAGFVNGLLDNARLESGHLSLSYAHCDVSRLLPKLKENFELLAAEKGLELSFSYQAGVPLLPCDEERIFQVLINLIGNAVKFTPNGGRIELRAEYNARSMVFIVSDDGPGIPPDQFEKVFMPLSQLEGAGGSGVGLGLSIAKKIVEAHGGNIWVHSRYGNGAQFHVRLPLKRTAADLRELPPRASSEGLFSRSTMVF